MKYILIILTLILIAGCYTKKQCYQFCEPVGVKDSINLVTKFKDSTRITDSTVVREEVRTRIETKNPCDSTGKLKSQRIVIGSGANKTELIITDSSIICKGFCKAAISRFREIIKEQSDRIAYYRDRKEVVEKREDLSWLKRFQQKTEWAWFVGWIFMIGGASIGIIWIIKKVKVI